MSKQNQKPIDWLRLNDDELEPTFAITEQTNGYDDKENRCVYKSQIDFVKTANKAVFKIFSDFFNVLYQDKKKQKEYGIKIIGLYRSGRFLNIANLYDFGEHSVLFEFKNLTVSMHFSVFRNDRDIHFELYMSSDELTHCKGEYIYNSVFENAIKESDLLGAYITMPQDVFHWSLNKMEKRDLSDIYLPKRQMEDLQMILDVFKNKGELLRYLFVGAPGTGKTESCLVLMNELKKSGVTIIKTPVCDYLQEKVQLAIMLKPSILIFDDIDLSLGSRSSGGYSSLLRPFLDVLDGTDKLPKDVGVVATTNSASLLDLAAQRPGRFDKVMIFDELSKENIVKIILKSLRFNFGITSKKDVEVFIDGRVVDKFYISNVTGAHIYNHTSMMKLKYDMMLKNDSLSCKKITTEWLLEEIASEIKIFDKIKEQEFLNDRMNNGRKKEIVFGKL